MNLWSVLTVAAAATIAAGCAAAPADDTASTEQGLATCACTGEEVPGEEIDFDEYEELNATDDGAASEATETTAVPAPAGSFQFRSDQVVNVGQIKVQIPQLKGDRCHAGGVAVHVTVTDAKGQQFKMMPTPDGWKTVDGRAGPSRNVMKQLMNNQRVVSAMAKIAKAAGFCVGALVFIGYDNYVSAGETSGYRILDKIKSLRSVQEICSPDENGQIRPVLPMSGTVPGGAPSGKPLQWEIIFVNGQWTYTTFYYEPDCGLIEGWFGCSAVKKVWVIGPDQQQAVPEQCLIR